MGGATGSVLDSVGVWWCFTSVCLGVGVVASAFSLPVSFWGCSLCFMARLLWGVGGLLLFLVLFALFLFFLVLLV